MNFHFSGKRITGVMTVLPQQERTFLEDMRNFECSESRALKLKAVMGYDRHRIADRTTCVSDLAVFGFEQLFQEGLVNPADIDGLILVTQSPDYFMPPTSAVIQGRLGLKQDLFTMDINQGCAGFVIGLLQACMMLNTGAIKKVALVNADVLSHKVSVKDKNSYPLVGDAAAITIIENDPAAGPIYANLQTDGKQHRVLIIPAGGFRCPSCPETSELQDVGDSNLRSQDNLHMDGTAVFNFVQTMVPPMIESLMALAGSTYDAVDYFVFHQPNRFMLEKLADKLGVPRHKMPNNVVEHFGNASGVTIPTALAYNLSTELLEHSLNLCFAGFGVGLTWASILMRVGPLDFCKMTDYSGSPA